MASQLLLRGLDGRTRVLRFDGRCVAGSAVLAAAGAACALPAGAFRVVTGASEVTPHASLCCDAAGLLPSATVLLRLRGGKVRLPRRPHACLAPLARARSLRARA